MQSSPSFVRQPECNGCVERFIRTLKEQFLWVRTFQNVEELRHGLAEFRERYNQRWIVQRLGPHASPGSPAASCTWSRCMNTLSSVSNKSGAKQTMLLQGIGWCPHRALRSLSAEGHQFCQRRQAVS